MSGYEDASPSRGENQRVRIVMTACAALMLTGCLGDPATETDVAPDPAGATATQTVTPEPTATEHVIDEQAWRSELARTLDGLPDMDVWMPLAIEQCEQPRTTQEWASLARLAQDEGMSADIVEIDTRNACPERLDEVGAGMALFRDLEVDSTPLCSTPAETIVSEQPENIGLYATYC